MYFLFTDGGARGNPGPAATGVFLFNQGMQLTDFSGTYLGAMTNNFAEYSALIEGLKLAKKHGVEEITCQLDSELAVKQVLGEYKVKEETLQKLHRQVIDLIQDFKSVSFKHIPREQNKLADKLVNQILDTAALGR